MIICRQITGVSYFVMDDPVPDMIGIRNFLKIGAELFISDLLLFLEFFLFPNLSSLWCFKWLSLSTFSDLWRWGNLDEALIIKSLTNSAKMTFWTWLLPKLFRDGSTFTRWSDYQIVSELEAIAWFEFRPIKWLHRWEYSWKAKSFFETKERSRTARFPHKTKLRNTHIIVLMSVKTVPIEPFVDQKPGTWVHSQ